MKRVRWLACGINLMLILALLGSACRPPTQTLPSAQPPGLPWFVDVTAEAGLDHPLWATSACFVDYDRDGWLDLVVTNYLDYDPTRVCSNAATRPRDYCSPKNFAGTVTKLYRNLGAPAGRQSKTVRFADVT